MANTNNTLGDAKYKLMLRGIAELQMTSFTQDADNPRKCTADEIAEWKVYRAAWHELMTNPPDTIEFDRTSVMLMKGFTIPDMPEGWVVMTRAVGDLPPLLCRVSELDSWDSSRPLVTTGAIGIPSA